ncbi:MAG: isoprenyl synthetase [Bacteroidia bacterium]|nr:MAG: isoprenyl synthetase [Bacteroidia bacterium]
MYSLPELQTIVSEKIEALRFDKPPQELYEPIRYSLSTGGKRIRPTLVLAGCDLFGGDVSRAVQVALAFEILHNFTLLHDDIMDDSPIRRNQPTVHCKWDSNTALLSGDAMMITAYGFLKKLPPKQLRLIFPLFNNTALEICEGQQYDLNFSSQDDVSEARYMEMIRLKTSVLLAACLKAGALLGDASPEDADLLYDFGLNIGIAFQLRDDLLDVYANEAEFGKRTGNDILTGKKTFLLIRALQQSEKKDRDMLLHLLKDKEIADKEKIARVTEIYNRLQIRDITEERIDLYHRRAVSSMEKVTVAKSRKQTLLTFSNQLKHRSK